MTLILSRKQLFKYLFVILLIGFIFGCVSLVYPFGRDQGIYAYIGKLITEGKIDYKYSYNLRPPGVHYVFAFSQMILGKSMMSMRIFDVFWQSITAFIIFLVTLNLSKKKLISLVPSILYIYLYYRLNYWHTLQTDGFMVLPFAVCILLLIKSGINDSGLSLFLAGCFFSITIFFKFTVIIFLPLLFVLIMYKFQDSIFSRFKKCFYFLTGFIVLALIVIAYYYFNDALNEFLEIQFVQIPLYAKIGFETESMSFIISNVIRLFTSSVYSPLILFSFITFLYLYINKNLTYDKLLLLIWIIISIVSLIAQWKFFTYHFIIIIAPLSISTALFVWIINDYYKKYPKIIFSSLFVITILFLIVSSKPYQSSYYDLYNFLKGNNSLKELYIKNGTTSDSVFTIKKVFSITDYLASNTEEKDKIYIWGIEPIIYYLSGRDCASRFTYNTPLYWRGYNSFYQKEFLNELNIYSPKIIMVAQRDPMYNITGFYEDSEKMLSKFPEFKDFIHNNYKFIAEIDDFKIYESKLN